MTSARGISTRRSTSIASGASSRSPEAATMTGSSTTCALVIAVEPGGHRLDRRGAREHADLHRVDGEVGKHGVDLRGDEVRRHVVDAGDAQRVLRGQRGDHGGAVDAERREGLEVRLDAGAAAEVRAGNGDCNGGHDRPRCASARSTMPRSARAASLGSSASDSAEMIETPSAPAAITSAALLALIPAMPQVGNAPLRR